MKEEVKISDFSAYLFWDVDISKFDLNKHAPQLTQKVIESGQLSDWELLLALYGKNKVKDIVLSLRSISPVTLSFLSNYFNIEPKKFRCYSHKQLVQNLWNS